MEVAATSNSMKKGSSNHNNQLYNEGDLPVQSPEISSSSLWHSQYLNRNSQFFQVFPHGRKSYRLNSVPSIAHPYQSQSIQDDNNATSKGPLLIIVAIFLTTLTVMLWIYGSFPELKSEEKKHMKIPFNLQDAKNLGLVLNNYKEDHFYHVYFGVCILYIFLQTFAIPGSLFLSILSGFLFSFWQAMLLVSTCSATGASFCFLISHLLGKRLIYKFFPERAAAWAVTVEKHRDNLLNYVIFLRVTPLVPNWFINLTAPVIGVPLFPFAFGTLLGVMPPSFVALQAGQTLHTLQSMSAGDSPMTWTSVVVLILFGGVALVPIYFKEKLKKKFD